jgi:hypothetical protein
MFRLHARTSAPLASILLLSAVGATGIASEAEAATRTVKNCNDSGAGSLRAAAAAADSGDTIDLRSLTCSRIMLTSGAIVLPDQFITIVGAGESKIRIDGKSKSRVFVHSGPWPDDSAATLRLRRLTVQNGLMEGTNPNGGCIFALRDVHLEHVHLRYCVVRPTNPDIRTSYGGGLHAGGQAVLFHAAVHGNRAEGGGEGGGLTAARLHINHSSIHDNYAGFRAGGASGALIFMTYSTIRDNVAGDVSGGLEGGSFDGRHVINKSTISGNVANRIGGLGFFGGELRISDSTISGNSAQFTPAGAWLEARGARITVRNSTITDNIALQAFGNTAAGADQYGTINWQSTIIANNFIDDVPSDLWAQTDFGAMVVGSDNLIETSNAPLPSDTLRGDPRLAPLADNGGRTWTHALLSGSRAIDAGNNNANYAYDQRGEGFPRVVNGRADIGAYELQD